MTVASRFLELLAERGIRQIMVNSGTDFAPLVEAYAAHESVDDLPRPVVATHEGLAVGMAHGAYLVTGTTQAVMLHVSVGSANAVCATINAARDRVPILVIAGRSPVLEEGALGARNAHIHWTQEMFDQAGMLREIVKWDYELRDPRQIDTVVDRAFSIAASEPTGPVYLSLPREALASEYLASTTPSGPIAPAAASAAPPALVSEIALRVAAADFPVLVTTSAGAEPANVPALADLCARHSIGIAEQGPRYVNVSIEHPNYLGHDDTLLGDPDVLIFLECDVPWIPATSKVRADAFVAQVGVDPLAAGIPIRGHRSDLTVTSSAANFLAALDIALSELATDESATARRREAIVARARRARDARDHAVSTERGSAGPITKASISVALADVADEHTTIFNEYPLMPHLMGHRAPGSYFFLPGAGGLGWALPAALGAKLVAPERTVVAAVGDGSYLFCNPAACHHASQLHQLPVLTIVANNSRWGAVEHSTLAVYPNGAARRARHLPFSTLAPLPDFERYAEASGGVGLRVSDRTELLPALAEGLRVVREERRQALVNIECT